MPGLQGILWESLAAGMAVLFLCGGWPVYPWVWMGFPHLSGRLPIFPWFLVCYMLGKLHIIKNIFLFNQDIWIRHFASCPIGFFNHGTALAQVCFYLLGVCPTGNRTQKKKYQKGSMLSFLQPAGQTNFKLTQHPGPLQTNEHLRQQMLHPQDPNPSSKQSNVVYSIHCNKHSNEHYIGETKQPLKKVFKKVKHSRANPSGCESAVHLNLKANNHSFENKDVHIGRKVGLSME